MLNDVWHSRLLELELDAPGLAFGRDWKLLHILRLIWHLKSFLVVRRYHNHGDRITVLRGVIFPFSSHRNKVRVDTPSRSAASWGVNPDMMPL
jgi:hypothetical protein